MSSNDVHDLPSLDVAFGSGDFKQMHHVENLLVETVLSRHGVWIGDRSRHLRIGEPRQTVLEIRPYDILGFKEENFLIIS
jgi:hypothetical protein